MDRTQGTVTRILRVGLAPIVLGLTLILPSTAALAAPSTHISEHQVDFGCDMLSGPGADAYIQPSWNSTFGSEARLQLWVHPANIIVDPPTIVSGEADFTVGKDDSSLTGTIDLLDAATLDLVGTAVLDARLTPSGELHYPELGKSTSNAKHRETHVVQPMAATGTLTLDFGGTQIVMALENCDGAASDFTAFLNDPASYVEWYDTRSVSCFFVGASMTVNFTGFEEYGLIASEVVVQTETGSYGTMDAGELTSLTRHDYQAALDLVPGGMGLASDGGGTITIDASMTAQPKESWTVEGENDVIRFVQQPYSIAGTATVSLADGTTETFSLSDADCHGGEFGYRILDRP